MLGHTQLRLNTVVQQTVKEFAFYVKNCQRDVKLTLVERRHLTVKQRVK